MNGGAGEYLLEYLHEDPDAVEHIRRRSRGPKRRVLEMWAAVSEQLRKYFIRKGVPFL